ncbi:hypothetical protein H4582DRAFT_1817862, partial [Lactarius indigo]
WSMYLIEAEKQDDKAAESWKGDTDGILVFTGLFSATVATFIIESYQQLSPDSSDTTNALLIQLSRQLVNISNGSPLESVAAQFNQPFQPTASAVRVNVLWFLSLVFSLTCALSATLMQQWTRRYRELAQRRGAPHRRGYVRAYIFDGISKFEMARVVATMPMLLHVSVFLFFVGLVDFLFPIDATVSYFTLGLHRGVRSGIRNLDGVTKHFLELPVCHSPVRTYMVSIPSIRYRVSLCQARDRRPISSTLVENTEFGQSAGNGARRASKVEGDDRKSGQESSTVVLAKSTEDCRAQCH